MIRSFVGIAVLVVLAGCQQVPQSATRQVAYTCLNSSKPRDIKIAIKVGSPRRYSADNRSVYWEQVFLAHPEWDLGRTFEIRNHYFHADAGRPDLTTGQIITCRDITWYEDGKGGVQAVYQISGEY